MKNHIQILEEMLLLHESRINPEIIAVLLADDFYEYGTSGVYSKKDVLEHLPVSKNEDLTLTDFCMHWNMKESVLCTYILYKKGEKHSFRSSFWVKNGNLWQMKFHQSSKLH